MKKFTIIILISFLFGTDSDLLTKAILAIKNGDYKEALIHVNKAQNTNQKNPDLYRLEALIYEMLDKPIKAKIAWKKCLRYSKDKSMNREAKIHIQSLSDKK
tara:strand:- start:403 stop:708 length:306 start_codon:yes stop_codon:yes gene_type:complete